MVFTYAEIVYVYINGFPFHRVVGFDSRSIVLLK